MGGPVSRPAPYYQDESVVIYHGDCREILPSLAPLDLIVTDPPYGIGIVYGDGVHDDSPDVCWAWFRDVLAMMRAAARQVVFTHRQEALRHLAGWDHVCAWHKPFNLTHSVTGWQAKWEPVFVYGGIVTKMQANAKRPSSTDSWAFSSVPNKHHPTEKPESLMREIISTFSGDVCDPFMGGGTTLRAAKDMGRRAIGIEIEERYCEIAARRMEQETLPLDVAAPLPSQALIPREAAP
jgi:site-specific DNA-methyltransferase (adenine-specific)